MGLTINSDILSRILCGIDLLAALTPHLDLSTTLAVIHLAFNMVQIKLDNGRSSLSDQLLLALPQMNSICRDDD
jgi:hypothetical protein